MCTEYSFSTCVHLCTEYSSGTCVHKTLYQSGFVPDLQLLTSLRPLQVGATAGLAALSAEVRKHDSKCRELNWVCTLMAVESLVALWQGNH